MSLYIAVPLAGLLYALVVQPLIISICNPLDVACAHASRIDNKLLWPALAAISATMIAVNWRRFSVPTNIAWLLAFVAYAGLTVVWAFRPELSSIRYAQQAMIVVSVALPALIMTGRGDLLRGTFLCFAIAAVINIFFVMGPPPNLGLQATPGHTGYFSSKNYLGLCAGLTLLLSLHEMLYPGRRRLLGLLVGAIALGLLYVSNAKTSAGLVLLCPVLAAMAVLLRARLGVSIVVIPLLLIGAYAVASAVPGFSAYKISYLLYGDSTFTGRRALWEFAIHHIWNRPLQGWGYQSFWLIGPDAPSVTTAKGWVKLMPNAHSGYLDTTLELGFVGLALLVTLIGVTLHSASRLVDHSWRRGWLVVTVIFYLVLTNFLESMWMRAFEFPWLMFLILSAEIGRSLQMQRSRGLARAAAARPATREPERAGHMRRSPAGYHAARSLAAPRGQSRR